MVNTFAALKMMLLALLHLFGIASVTGLHFSGVLIGLGSDTSHTYTRDDEVAPHSAEKLWSTRSINLTLASMTAGFEAHNSLHLDTRSVECMSDGDCGWHAKCDQNRECAAKSLGEDLRADCLMCALAFVISGFSLAAGVGGGGLYVPLLMSVLSIDAHVATALSQAMLCGGACAAFVYNSQSTHPSRPGWPLINFELACLIGSALMAGAQLGSVLHATAPTALVLVLLCLVLSDSARKAVRSALKMVAVEQKPAAQGSSQPTDDAVSSSIAEAACQRSAEWQRKLLLIWAVCIGLVLWKGLFVPMCSPAWWALTFGASVVLGGAALSLASRFEASVDGAVHEGDVDLRELSFPLVRWSFLAGALAALCGIGGGMIMGPLLVELKVPPPVSSAVTATTLLVLSSSTLLVYWCRDVAPQDYAMCLSFFTMAGAMTGKIVVNWWVQRTGQQSVIVWALAGVTILSTVLMGLQGIRTVSDEGWASLSFQNFCGLLPSIAVPFQD